MRLLPVLLVAAVAATATGIAQAPPANASAPRIAMDEFRKLHAHGGVDVIDVRSAEAYAGGHIPGARSIPLATFNDPEIVGSLRGSRKPIVLYCA